MHRALVVLALLSSPTLGAGSKRPPKANVAPAPVVEAPAPVVVPTPVPEPAPAVAKPEPAVEVSRLKYFKVVSQKDLETMIGVERQLLGCSEEATSGVSELADAMGARFVLSGVLGRLGESSFQLGDSSSAVPSCAGSTTTAARTGSTG